MRIACVQEHYRMSFSVDLVSSISQVSTWFEKRSLLQTRYDNEERLAEGGNAAGKSSRT